MASSFDPLYPPYKLLDGQQWYLESPPNRWQPDHDDASPWAGVDFGIERTASEIRVYPHDGIDDVIPNSGGQLNSNQRIRVPAGLSIEYWLDGRWAKANVTAQPDAPAGRQANIFRLATPVSTRKVRVVLTPSNDSLVALSEFEAWGPADLPLIEPPPPSGNLAIAATVTVSSQNRPDPGEKAIDGIINYDLNGGPNRWATARRPKGTPVEELGSDWLSLDFGKETNFNEVRLHFCRSRYGMGAPARYELQVKDGDQWGPVELQERRPADPTAETINIIRFPSINTSQLRLVVHHGDRRLVCALSEMEVFAESRESRRLEIK
jgi:hypothetical protein